MSSAAARPIASNAKTVYIREEEKNPFMTVIPVATLELPALQAYRTLRRPMEHAAQGIFVAEGEKVVRRLLASGLETISLLCTAEWLEALRPAVEGHAATVYVAPKQLVETIVGYNLHQGIMAIGRIPQPARLEDLLAKKGGLLLVGLDGLVHAENVGVVVRNCVAFGVDGLLVGETSSSPYLRRAVRNSMGAVFRIPIVSVPGLAACIAGPLREHAVVSVAAHPHESDSLFAHPMPDRLCLILGNEGLGISDAVLRVCDRRIGIPMENGVDSLNVASASAAFLTEIVRQRHQRQP